MNTDITDRPIAARRAIEKLLTAANGGSMPGITVHVTDDAMAPLPPFDPDDKAATVFAHVACDDRLTVAVGIRVHWKTLWQTGFHMARTPSGLLCLLGLVEGRLGHFVVEDDRLWGEADSPMLSADQDRAAIAAFDAEFAALMAEAQ